MLEERFAVIGFEPEGSAGLLMLRLACREGEALVYVGRVGTGWERETAWEIAPGAVAASPSTSSPGDSQREGNLVRNGLRDSHWSAAPLAGVVLRNGDRDSFPPGVGGDCHRELTYHD
jgi:hypothetical protein